LQAARELHIVVAGCFLKKHQKSLEGVKKVVAWMHAVVEVNDVNA
jgi:hypothetical protein